MAIDIKDAPRAAIVKTGISMHRDVHRKIMAVASYRGMSFQEWAYTVLVREMERELPEARAALAD